MLGTSRLAFGTALLGVTGVSSLATYSLIREKTIEEKLTRDEYHFLDVSESGQDESSWSQLVSGYSSITDKIPNLSTISGSGSGSGTTELKNKCKELKASKISDDIDGKKEKAAKECCTKESSVLKNPKKSLRQPSEPQKKAEKVT